MALFTNVLHQREEQILSCQREMCNYHLARRFVEDQICEDLLRARVLRTLKPEKAPKPKFRFVSSIFSAVYEGERRIIHTASWDKTHEEVASKAHLGHRDLFSGDVFCLRAIPQVKIFTFSNSKKINSNDIQAMNEAGYLVMDDEYRWMIPDSTLPEGIAHLVSPITPDFARA